MRTHRTIRILENPNYGNKDVELQSLQKQMMDCLSDSAFERGLKIALDAIDRFLEKPTVTHSWAVDFYMSLGRRKRAMKVLEQGFRRGAWWSPNFLMSSLKELEDHPAFCRALRDLEEKTLKNSETF